MKINSTSRQVIMGAAILVGIGALIYFGKFQGGGVEVPIVTSPLGDWKTYRSAQFGFELRYPEELDDRPSQILASDDLDSLGPNTTLEASFPLRYRAGTNLVAATIYAGAKKVTQETDCWKIFGNEIGDYGDGRSKFEDVAISGVSFRRANVRGEVGRSIYDITRYATFKTDTCFLLTLIAHNKDLGIAREADFSVQAYDAKALQALFEEVVKTFRFIESPKETGKYANPKFGIELTYPARFAEASPSAPWSVYNGTSTIVAFESYKTRMRIPDELIVVSRFRILPGASFEKMITDYTFLDPSGLHPTVSDFKRRTLGGKQFRYLRTTRFEGTLGFAYYYSKGQYVYRFDSIAQGVDWTNPELDEESDPTHIALREVLKTVAID